MPEDTITITRVDAEIAAFGRFRGIYEEEIAEVTDGDLGAMARILATYPSERSGQHSIRTMALRDGWLGTDRRFRITAGGIDATLTNPVGYTRWVEGDEDQAWMHQGRWPTVGKVQDEYRPQVAAHFEAAIDRAIARAGL